MLSAEDWWGIMALYGERVWPAQIILYLLALGATVFVFARPGPSANAVMRLYLAAALGWISFVFFFLIGRELAGNIVFGCLFGSVALLFVADLFRKRMDFVPPRAGWERPVSLLLAVAIFAYPGMSLALGHKFPYTIVTGTHPCPTTSLALLMLTFALPRADKVAYGLLLFWAVPLPPFIQIPRYGVYEDGIMLAVGLYAGAMLIRNWTHQSRSRCKTIASD